MCILMEADHLKLLEGVETNIQQSIRREKYHNFYYYHYDFREKNKKKTLNFVHIV